jgi:hypothetical protein
LSSPLSSSSEKSSGSGVNRRAYVRYAMQRKGSCQVPFSKEMLGDLTAQIVDISVKGIGLILSRPFWKRTILSVELSAASPEGSRNELVIVQRTMEQPDGRWLVGCVFARPLSEEELQELL